MLLQLVQRKKHSLKYESRICSSIKKKYDITKQKLRGILKVLKKVRYWLYGVRFILKIDANILVAQLNQLYTDLRGALVTR